MARVRFSSKSVLAHPELLRLSARQQTRVFPQLLDFLKSHPCRVSLTLGGLITRPWTNADIREIEGLVIRNNPERKGRDLLRVLRKAARFWSLQNRALVPLPRIPITPRKSRSPFNSNLAGILNRYDDCQQILHTWLRQAGARDRLLECLVVSAMLYGGLLCNSLLASLIRSIAEKNSRTLVVNGKTHVELWLSWRGIPCAELRRWQPDLLSATLWMCITPDQVQGLLAPVDRDGALVPPSDREIVRRLGLRICDALRDTSGQFNKPRNLNALLHISKTTAYAEIPALLVGYASREIVSHSLCRPALQRLTGNNVPPAAGVEIDGALCRSSRLTLAEDADEDSDIAKLEEAFAAEERREVRQRLQAIAGSTQEDPTIRCLADFGDSLLGSTASSGKARSVTRAKTTLISVTNSLRSVLDEGEDPSSLDTADLESLYVQAIEGAAPAESSSTDGARKAANIKTRSARALSEFHDYLSARFGKEPVEDSAVLAYFDGLAKVEANLLTLEDYDAALAEIDRRWPASERRAIARILLFLGFRCGLRRREALYLRLQDLETGGHGELFVRPFAGHRLKTIHARRRLPLFALLSPEEFNELRHWVQHRIDELGRPGDFLFSIPREGLSVVPESFFEEINDVLRVATGDQTIHFHAFRHSFCTFLLLRLIVSDLQPIPDLFQPQTSEWFRRSPQLRKQLYGNSMHTRRHAYLLAQLAAHGSPRTTLENYTHCLDWALAIHLERSQLLRPSADVTEELVRRASGRARSTLDGWIEKGGIETIPVKLWQHSRPPEVPPPRSIRTRADCRVKSHLAADASVDDWITPAWNFLDELARDRRSLEEASARHEFSPHEGRQMVERANYLATLSNANDTGTRHPMMVYPSCGRISEQSDPCSCPRKPVRQTDKTVVGTFLNAIRKLADDDKSYFEAGLRLYVEQVREGGFLRFDDIGAASDAAMYLGFMRRLHVDLRHAQYVSGDSAKRSAHRAAWRTCLRLDVHCKIESKDGHFGPATALSVRPRLTAESPGDIGQYGFRFALVMAFVRFGRIPRPN